MRIGGFNKEVEYAKLGPTLVIASSLVLAIRTARWERDTASTASQRDWQAEADKSISIAKTILSHLLAKSPEFFQRKDVPWYVPSEDDVQK